MLRAVHRVLSRVPVLRALRAVHSRVLRAKTARRIFRTLTSRKYIN
jgi:hypothetical protein